MAEKNMWFLSCCTASVWRHFMPPDKTNPSLYKTGYRPACISIIDVVSTSNTHQVMRKHRDCAKLLSQRTACGRFW